MHFAHFP